MNKVAPQLDFSNTQLAFQAKSDLQLRKAYWLFKMIGIPWINAIGPKLLSTSLKIGLPVKGIVKKTLFEVFCGGESLAETARTSAYLFQFNVRTILDYSVEGERNEEGFDRTANEIVNTLLHGGNHEEVAFSACKITGFGKINLLEKAQLVLREGKPLSEGLSEKDLAAFEQVRARIDKICQTAVDQKTPVFIDAEESWMQDTIDMLAEEMMEKYNGENAWVATTVQMYRWDRLVYLKELIQRSKTKGYQLGIKVVRGAYLEKETDRAEEMGYKNPMQPDKQSTDHDYDVALRLCIENIDHVHICAGTHNETSSLLLTQLMKEKGLPNDHSHILFSQLLGMSDHISFNLGHAGYNTAKYLPYGPVKAVMPYLIRRANENTSVAGQSSRELKLLRTEFSRRKKERK
jgi:proline dehydrogenase